jgi:tetratricopeptide (TPR) repeat protein
MLKSFQHEIQTILAPSYETISLTLMPNKPKNDLAKNGYKLAEAGSLRASYSLFLDIWNQDRHFPSGYNAALLLEALGDLSGAIDLMEAVCDFSQNSACYEQIGRMKEALAKQGQAEKQISGEESAGDQVVTKTQLITME